MEDAEDFNAGVLRQFAIENEVLGEAVHFPGVEVLQSGMAEVASAQASKRSAKSGLPNSSENNRIERSGPRGPLVKGAVQP